MAEQKIMERAKFEELLEDKQHLFEYVSDDVGLKLIKRIRQLEEALAQINGDVIGSDIWIELENFKE